MGLVALFQQICNGKKVHGIVSKTSYLGSRMNKSLPLETDQSWTR
jgi:hypothetical protein